MKLKDSKHGSILFFSNSQEDVLMFPLSQSKDDKTHIVTGFAIIMYSDIQSASFWSPMQAYDLDYMYKPRHLLPNYNLADSIDICGSIIKASKFDTRSYDLFSKAIVENKYDKILIKRILEA